MESWWHCSLGVPETRHPLPEGFPGVVCARPNWAAGRERIFSVCLRRTCAIAIESITTSASLTLTLIFFPPRARLRPGPLTPMDPCALAHMSKHT